MNRKQDLSNSSGMAETMASDIVSEDQMLSGSRNSITFLLDPHFPSSLLKINQFPPTLSLEEEQQQYAHTKNQNFLKNKG